MNEQELVAKYSSLHSGRDRTNFGALDVLHAEGSGLDALLYGFLFWPEFVEYQGMIFRRDTVEDDDDRRCVDDALKRYGGDASATEKSFNTVEIGSLFGARSNETDDATDRDLALLLCEMWSARLAQVFHPYKCRVELVEPEVTGGSVGLIFWRER